MVIDVVGAEKCDPLDFAVSKYNNGFIFATVEGFPGSRDPAVPLVTQLTVSITGDPLGNTECQNHPRMSEDLKIYEHCMQ